MKKNKFLKGMSALFALGMVALTTTLTSCEKEDLSYNVDVNVDVSTPGATLTVTPTVLFVNGKGNITDVSADADITYSGLLSGSGKSISYSANENEGITGGTLTITAEYSDFDEVSTDVVIPDLSAGQNLYLTPLILINDEASEYTYTITTTPVDASESEVYNIDNETAYYWNTSRTYTAKQGVTNATIPEIPGDATDFDYLSNLANTIVNTYAETTKTIEFYVGAYSRTTITVTYNKENVTMAVTKTDGDETLEVGEVTYTNYISTNADVTAVDQQIPGFSHEPLYHGHGHGNDANAGGGISSAD